MLKQRQGLTARVLRLRLYSAEEGQGHQTESQGTTQHVTRAYECFGRTLELTGATGKKGCVAAFVLVIDSHIVIVAFSLKIRTWKIVVRPRTSSKYDAHLEALPSQDHTMPG